METVRLVLSGEKPESWNKYNTGVHWSERKADTDRAHQVVRAAIDPDKAKIFDVPVHIHITAWFKDGREQLDAWNIYSKPYVDALQGWYIKDDSPKHVPYGTVGSFIDKRRPRVEIEIRPIKETPF